MDDEANRDMLGHVVHVGDVVAAAFREGNVAYLRRGEVRDLAFVPEPHVEGSAEMPPVWVVWVKWTHTTGTFLPRKTTKIATRKVLKVSE